MKKILSTAVLAAIATFAVAPAAFACDDHDEGTTAAVNPIQEFSVAQLSQKLSDSKNKKSVVAVFDANSEKTRKEMGIIPTAILLPSSSEYDLKLLPQDKAAPVVFYCASEKCGASHTAAERAAKAGYTQVGVMKAGIKGWVAAGYATQKTLS